LDFDLFYQLPPGQAEAYLEAWCDGVRRSRLAPLQPFVRLVDDHWEGIIRWHWTRIGTGVLEGINSLVQAAKRRARGYRTNRNLIAMIYMIAGRIHCSHTHTNKRRAL